MRQHLVDLGQRAVSAVADGIAAGEPLPKCQLLASEFYEALRRELRRPCSTNDAHRATLIAAVGRCERIASPSIGAGVILAELGNALAALQGGGARLVAEQRPRAVLRVINGGLSNA